MLKDNTRAVWQYLKDNNGSNMTLDDIAAATGLTAKQVNGCVVGLQRVTDKKPAYAFRTPAKIQLADGTTKEVKFIALTEEGLALNPDAE